jgi:hypothetical protein
LEIDMRHGGGFRVLAAFLLIGFIGLIAAGAFGAGYVAGSGPSAAPAAPWVRGGAFGAGHLFGFLLALFVLFVVIRLMVVAFGGPRHHAWAARGRWGETGPCGPDDWHRGAWHRAGETAFDEWHRKSHERSGATPPDRPEQPQ